MTVKEKLIDLLTDNLPRCGNLPHWDNPLQLSCDEQVERIADHLIANDVTIPEWFSVKDRLPDKRGEYLCYYKFEPDSPDVICENTYQGSGLWLSEMDKVTHWQYLPQPPKGE